MPDHIHGILFVHEKIERHLGHVINGFKTGTRKAAKELGLLSQGYQAEDKPQQTEPITLSCPSSKVQYAEVEPQPKHSPIGTLWEPGYKATTTASFFIRTNWPICWLISTTTLVAFC